jgi:hypothetical protein
VLVHTPRQCSGMKTIGHRLPPGHLIWMVRTIVEFQALGQLTLSYPTCGRAWETIWDPWRREGRGHAVWIE